MIEIKTAILISVALAVYYIFYHSYGLMKKVSMATDTPNKKIEKFRTDYQVNIRTFQDNSVLNGFVWFKTIWLNENLFRQEKCFYFNFRHEYYHLIHKHKQKTLLVRLGLALMPLLLVVIPYYLFIPLFLSVGWLVQNMNNRFEQEANTYAHKMTAYE